MPPTDRFSYEGLFAANSPEVAPGTSRHAKYDFAVAYPDPDTLPLDGLADAVRSVLMKEGRDLAYYPEAAGDPELRQLVVEKLARDRNIHVTPKDMVLTSGSGEAISMVIQALTNSGDAVPTEEFTYLGTLRSWWKAHRRAAGDLPPWGPAAGKVPPPSANNLTFTASA